MCILKCQGYSRLHINSLYLTFISRFSSIQALRVYQDCYLILHIWQTDLLLLYNFFFNHCKSLKLIFCLQTQSGDLVTQWYTVHKHKTPHRQVEVSTLLVVCSLFVFVCQPCDKLSCQGVILALLRPSTRKVYIENGWIH